MEYYSVEEARHLPGLRLVLSAYVPGPWGEAAKAVFKSRNVPFIPVMQQVFDSNDDLRAWTGFRNAPIAIVDDEPPATGWHDIVMLAERLGSGPSLLPAQSEERALSIGISAEICSVEGFGWCRRLLMFDKIRSQFRSDPPPNLLAAWRQYRFNPATISIATDRVVDIMGMLTRQLRNQRHAGSPYLVGSSLTACDIHWACFSMMIAPLPHEDAPMTRDLFDKYSDICPEIAAALDSILLEHRDLVFQHHIGLPLEF